MKKIIKCLSISLGFIAALCIIGSRPANAALVRLTPQHFYTWAQKGNTARLEKYKRYINIGDKNQNTALCLAQQAKDRKAYSLLLDYNASPNVPCHDNGDRICAVIIGEKLKVSPAGLLVLGAGALAAGAYFALDDDDDDDKCKVADYPLDNCPENGVCSRCQGKNRLDGCENNHVPNADRTACLCNTAAGYYADADTCKTVNAGYECKEEFGCYVKSTQIPCNAGFEAGRTSCNDKSHPEGWKHSQDTDIPFSGGLMCGRCDEFFTPIDPGVTDCNTECPSSDGGIIVTKVHNGWKGDIECFKCTYECEEGTFETLEECINGGYSCDSNTLGDKTCWLRNGDINCNWGYTRGLENCDAKAHPEEWDYTTDTVTPMSGGQVCGKCTAKQATCREGTVADGCTASKFLAAEDFDSYAGDTECYICRYDCSSAEGYEDACPEGRECPAPEQTPEGKNCFNVVDSYCPTGEYDSKTNCEEGGWTCTESILGSGCWEHESPKPCTPPRQTSSFCPAQSQYETQRFELQDEYSGDVQCGLCIYECKYANEAECLADNKGYSCKQQTFDHSALGSNTCWVRGDLFTCPGNEKTACEPSATGYITTATPTGNYAGDAPCYTCAYACDTANSYEEECPEGEECRATNVMRPDGKMCYLVPYCPATYNFRSQEECEERGYNCSEHPTKPGCWKQDSAKECPARTTIDCPTPPTGFTGTKQITTNYSGARPCYTCSYACDEINKYYTGFADCRTEASKTGMECKRTIFEDSVNNLSHVCYYVSDTPAECPEGTSTAYQSVGDCPAASGITTTFVQGTSYSDQKLCNSCTYACSNVDKFTEQPACENSNGGGWNCSLQTTTVDGTDVDCYVRTTVVDCRDGYTAGLDSCDNKDDPDAWNYTTDTVVPVSGGQVCGKCTPKQTTCPTGTYADQCPASKFLKSNTIDSYAGDTPCYTCTYACDQQEGYADTCTVAGKYCPNQEAMPNGKICYNLVDTICPEDGGYIYSSRTDCEQGGWTCSESAPNSGCWKQDSALTCNTGYSTTIATAADCGEQGSNGWTIERDTVIPTSGGKACNQCVALPCDSGSKTEYADTSKCPNPFTTLKVSGHSEANYSGENRCYSCTYACANGEGGKLAYSTQAACEAGGYTCSQTNENGIPCFARGTPTLCNSGFSIAYQSVADCGEHPEGWNWTQDTVTPTSGGLKCGKCTKKQESCPSETFADNCPGSQFMELVTVHSYAGDTICYTCTYSCEISGDYESSCRAGKVCPVTAETPDGQTCYAISEAQCPNDYPYTDEASCKEGGYTCEESASGSDCWKRGSQCMTQDECEASCTEENSLCRNVSGCYICLKLTPVDPVIPTCDTSKGQYSNKTTCESATNTSCYKDIATGCYITTTYPDNTCNGGCPTGYTCRLNAATNKYYCAKVIETNDCTGTNDYKTEEACTAACSKMCAMTTDGTCYHCGDPKSLATLTDFGGTEITSTGSEDIVGMESSEDITNGSDDTLALMSANTTPLNGGNITLIHNSTGNAYGMRGLADNTLTNEATGNITIHNNATGTAYGMYTSLGGSAINRGNITITGTTGTAYGIYGEGQNNIENSGTIDVSGRDAYGIYVKDGKGSTVLNTISGIININASGEAHGIYIDENSHDAVVKNEGKIVINNVEKPGATGITLNGATLENANEVSFSGDADLNSMGGRVVLAKGGSFKAMALSGDVDAGTSTVMGGNKDTYVSEAAFKSEDVSGLNVKSESAMFDAKVEKNANGNGYNVTQKRKAFAEFTPNASIANYLEANYEDGALEETFDEIKSQTTETGAAQNLAKKLGYDVMPNFADENFTIMKSLTRNIADNVLKPTDEINRVVAGYDNFSWETDTKGTLSGSDLSANTMYTFGDKRLDNKNRLGLGLSFTQLSSNYDTGSSRDLNIVSIFVPYVHKFTDKLRLATVASVGYGYGDYDRGSNESDINDIFYSLSNELRYTADLNGFAELEPALMLNAIGYTEDGFDEGDGKDALETQKTHNLSVEAGVGLYLKKDIRTEKYGKLGFKVGGAYYHEFGSPYDDISARFKNQGSGWYRMNDYAGVYNRDRAIIEAMIDYEYKRLSLYLKYNRLIQKNNPQLFDLGVKYNF